MKLLLACLIRLILSVFCIAPVRDRRIFFTVHGGKFYNCNPKYVYQYLEEHYPGKFECVWCLSNPDMLTDSFPGTVVVRPRTIQSVSMVLTSRMIISNTGFSSILPKRRGQVYLNTWHGGGSYKKCGLDVPHSGENEKVQMDAGCRTDIFLSCSADFSRNMSKAKNIPLDRFAATGTPRNDMFFTEKCRIISDRLREKMSLNGWSAALYAPTFRGTEKTAISHLELDVKLVRESLIERFGGRWKILVRRHPFSTDGNLPESVDVSAYPDIQELLCLADVLITDYSSCLWDYSLTGRPCFVLADDIEVYEEERGFYTPVSEWPYPIAHNNQELSRLIREFDADEYKNKVKRHHESLESYEDGRASERVADMLVKIGERQK